MDKGDATKQQSNQAWFIVDNSAEEEQFTPLELSAFPEPMQMVVMQPAGDSVDCNAELGIPNDKECLSPEQEQKMAENAEISVPQQKEKVSQSQEPVPLIEPVVSVAVVPIEYTAPELPSLGEPAIPSLPPPISGSAVVLSRDQNSVVELDGQALAPAAEHLRDTPDTQPTYPSAQHVQLIPSELQFQPVSKSFGFRLSDVSRMGGSTVMTPAAHVGLMVTTRTPQRVRLGQVTVLKEARTAIGRGRVGCFVDDPEIADYHAIISYQRDGDSVGFRLHTCVSAPTRVNGRNSESVEQLHSGDRIAIGNTELVYLEVELQCEGKM